MKLILISITVKDSSFKINQKDFEAEEKPKSYSYSQGSIKRRIFKSQILQIESPLRNSISSNRAVLGYLTYCLEHQKGEAISILKAKAKQRVLELNEGVLSLIGAVKDL